MSSAGSQSTVSDPASDAVAPHTISIVVPVYRGAETLPALIAEIAPMSAGFVTEAGHPAVVSEVLLVHDHGPDRSDVVLRELRDAYDFVKPVWLSRNFGQHAATLAGMGSSGGDWIATIDEDGQYDPAQIGRLLDAALGAGATVVYARPTNPPPHSPFRNVASRMSKRMVDALTGDRTAREYHSFRLVLGEVGRSLAAYVGSGVYLDVALGWVAGDIVTAPVELREEGGRPSGYNFGSLLAHFWRLVLTSGTRGLRVVSMTGLVMAGLGVVAAIVLVVGRISGASWPAGWASAMVVMLVLGGLVLLCLGIVAEYIGVAVDQAMGKPPYLIVSDPADGPLGRRNTVVHPRSDTEARE